MVISNEFDTLFYQASFGDNVAFNLLFEKFVKEGNKIVRTFGPIGRKHYAFFYEVISDTFLICLKGFDFNFNNFGAYSKVVLKRSLIKALNEATKEITNNVISLDQNVDDDRPLVEIIEDKSIMPIPDNYSLDQFKQRISSPRYKSGKNVNLRAKINSLVIAGFTQDEICKKLGISIGVLRYNLKLNQEDEELANLKLELK